MIEESIENCIAFDDDDVETRVRILPPDQFKQTQELEAECEEFISKTSQFNDLVKVVVKKLEDVSKCVEVEKMKAIGQRNRLESEEKDKERQRVGHENIIREKRVMLERYQTQYVSLKQVEACQIKELDMLQNQ